MKMRVGDWVEVRSKEEILSTLDNRGRLEGLPYMPQMFKYCGQKFQVYKHGHKTCDWVYTGRSRRLKNGIHLNLRCDGEDFGGCQTACLIYWKEAWLKPVDEVRDPVQSGGKLDKTNFSFLGDSTNYFLCTERDVLAGTRTEPAEKGNEQVYTCQGTDVPYFTTQINWWQIGHILEDYTSGNVSLGQLLRGILFASYNKFVNAGIGLGPPLRWLYDRLQAIWGGLPYPRTTGTIAIGQQTPESNLMLMPGESVRVKLLREILLTLNKEGKNRGLSWDPEMVPYCGGVYRVKARVNKFIDEKTGKLSKLKNECIVLENVYCRSRYSTCRMFCPRSIYPWWHEVWLERVKENMVLTEHKAAMD